MGHQKWDEINVLGEDIARWRVARKKMGPMPDILWEKAVELAKTHGVSQVSSRLGLGFSTLKSKVQAASLTIDKKPEAGSDNFIELPPCTIGSRIQPEEKRPFRMEVGNPDGHALRMEFPAGNAAIAAQLMRTFLGQHG